MAIITTTETLKARPGHPAEERTTVSGETDYVPPKRFIEPPAPKQAVLTLDEVRERLAVETHKFEEMNSEINQLVERSTEVRMKLFDNERALDTALAQNKSILADYARGKADDKSVTMGKANIRDLEDLIAGLEDVKAVIASELAALQGPREKQKRLMDSYHDMAWSLAVDIEREKAQPFLQRAYFAQMQSRRTGQPIYNAGYTEAMANATIPCLLEEYNLPSRY